MDLSRLLNPGGPHARVAAVAALGAMLVVGCGKDDGAVTPAEADEQIASYVVKTVQCESGPPPSRVSRPRTEVGTPVAPSAAVSAKSVDEAVTADPAIPRLPYEKREIADEIFLFTHAEGGKIRVALTVVPNPDVPGQWEWSTVSACAFP